MRRLAALAARHEAPVVVQTPFAPQASVPVAELRAAGIPCVESPEEVAAVLTAMRRPTGPRATRLPPVVDDPSLGQAVDRVLDALDAESVAQAVGRVVTETDLPSASPELWVLRLDGIPHKTAAGAIRLGLRGSELEHAYHDLVRRAAELDLPPRVRLAPFVPHDYELLVSLWRTSGSARGLAFGTGGTRLDDAHDLVTAAWPDDAQAAVELMSRTTIGRRLRAEAPAGLGDVAELILALGRAFARLPELAELECNPVAVGDANVVVLDVLPTQGAAHGSSA